MVAYDPFIFVDERLAERGVEVDSFGQAVAGVAVLQIVVLQTTGLQTAVRMLVARERAAYPRYEPARSSSESWNSTVWGAVSGETLILPSRTARRSVSSSSGTAPERIRCQI